MNSDYSSRYQWAITINRQGAIVTNLASQGILRFFQRLPLLFSMRLTKLDKCPDTSIKLSPDSIGNVTLYDLREPEVFNSCNTAVCRSCSVRFAVFFRLHQRPRQMPRITMRETPPDTPPAIAPMLLLRDTVDVEDEG